MSLLNVTEPPVEPAKCPTSLSPFVKIRTSGSGLAGAGCAGSLGSSIKQLTTKGRARDRHMKSVYLGRPLPILNIRHVITMFRDVQLVLDQLVPQDLLLMGGRVA